MAESIPIRTPLADEVVEKLKIGDNLLISGVIYTSRDAAHKRLVSIVNQGEELTFDIKGQIICYVGQTPPRPGMAIGSARPTTSHRMDLYTRILIEKGLKGMMGKGSRGSRVIEAMKKHKAIYLGATGGAGALISKAIKNAEIIAYSDLGPEVIGGSRLNTFPRSW